MPNPYWSTAGGARVGPLPPAPLADRLKVPLPEPRRGFSSVCVTAYMRSRDIPGLRVAAPVFLHPTDSPGETEEGQLAVAQKRSLPDAPLVKRSEEHTSELQSRFDLV